MRTVKYPFEAHSYPLFQQVILPRMTFEHEVRALIYLMKQINGDVAELGCGVGVTSSDLCLHLPEGRQLFAFDWTQNNRLSPKQEIEKPTEGKFALGAGLQPLVKDRCTIIDGDIHNFPAHAQMLKDVRMVFIDDDHTYDGVMASTEWAMKLREAHKIPAKEFILAWHDVSPFKPCWVGVLDYLQQNWKKACVIEGTQIAYIKI